MGQRHGVHKPRIILGRSRVALELNPRNLSMDGGWTAQ